MTLSGLLDVAVSDPALARALSQARVDHDVVAPPSLWPILSAALARTTGQGIVLAVTATGREAEDLAGALTCLLAPDRVAHFPAWETLPHEKLSPRSDTVGQRLAVLRRLAHPDAGETASGPLDVVVTPVRAVLQPVVSGLGDLEPVRLRPQDDAELDDVVRRLVDAGYTRVDLVEKRGEIAVRGGILDVFPPTEEHPLRVEFWGDTVEEIRYFKAADQRSLEIAQDGLWAPPCRELPLSEQVRERAKALAEEHPALEEILTRIADGEAVEGMEAFSPVLADRMELLVDLLPAGSTLLVCEPERIRTRAHELVRTSQEFLEASWVNAAAGGEAPIDLEAAAFRSLEEVRERAAGLGIDPGRLAVGGASAGANLAAGVALRGRDDGAAPWQALLAYPLVHAEHWPAPSGELAARLADMPQVLRFPADIMALMNENYLGGPARDAPPCAFVGDGNGTAADLTGYPPAYIENCENDDLRASGEAFARQLTEAGADVEVVTCAGVPHGHLNAVGSPLTSRSLDRFAARLARAA